LNRDKIELIKKRILVALFLLILIFASIRFYIDFGDYQEIRDAKMEHKSEQIKSFFEVSLQNMVNTYIIKENYLLNQKEIITAFKDRDREELLKLIQPLYNQWKGEDSSLQILHFHLPDNRSFLRIHKPEKFGDDLTKVRPIIATVNLKKEFLKGFEVGKYNTNVLTYRLAFPIFDGKEYLGSVEFGINFLEKMKEFYSLYGSLYETEQEQSFYSGFLIKTIKLQHLQSSYSYPEYGEFSLINNSSFVRDSIAKGSIDPKRLTEYQNICIEDDERFYRLYSNGIYIKNYRKGVDGTALYLIDVTEEVRDFRLFIIKSIIFYILMIIAVSIAVIRVLNFFSEKVEDKSAELEELEHWKHEVLSLFEDGNIAIMKVETNDNYRVSFSTDSIKDILGYSLSHIDSGLSLKDDLVCKDCWEDFITEVFEAELSFKEHLRNSPLRIRKRDGSLIWVQGVSALSFDKDRRMDSFLFAIIDVTDLKRVESQLTVYKNRLELAIESTKDGLWDLDLINKDIYLSKQMLDMLQKEESFYKRVIKTNSFDKVKKMLIHPEDLNLFNTAIQKCVEKESDYFGVEVRIKRGDNSYQWYMVRGRVMFDEEIGVPCRIIGFNTDINKQKQIEAHLKELATIDELTGVANRTKVNELLDREVDRARRYRNPLSLIYFDIDHFKQVNDTYGHKSGDNVLIEITKLINAELRKTDTLARWGGEEFLIVIPETSLQNGVVLAEKLREIIEEHKFEDVSKITCSFGVTQFTLHDDIDRFIERADKALYEAKDAGRNSVVALTGDA
jgi:diguanylate cyclase (GGDEF)-like protein/PAS domain S-box-containing protein